MPTARGLVLPTSDPEQRIVDAARAGDLAAWRQLHDRYRGPVLGFLRRLGGDEDDFQETFLRAFRAIGTFERGRPFLPWLLAIARNLRTDARRRPRPSPEEVPRPSTERPDEVAAANELLEKALGSLTEFERRLVRLRHGEGKSVAETAFALGCNYVDSIRSGTPGGSSASSSRARSR